MKRNRKVKGKGVAARRGPKEAGREARRGRTETGYKARGSGEVAMGTHALRAGGAFVEEGCDTVVDLDMEKFLDRVNHDILMGRLARRIDDKRLLLLIRRFPEAGMMWEGVCVRLEEGTPQGDPLSPLLANLLLDEPGKELEKRGHRFCRNADDCDIHVRSPKAGERVLQSVTWFLETRLTRLSQLGRISGNFTPHFAPLRSV